MPLSGIGSYVPTADQFVSHWGKVNEYRLAENKPELSLLGNYSRAMFVADRDQLDAAIRDLQRLKNDREFSADVRDERKEALVQILAQFRASVSVYLQNSRYSNAAPLVPNLPVAESKFMRPFDDSAVLWGKINADPVIPDFTGPLLLRGGYGLADFLADIEAMRAAFRAVDEADGAVFLGRERRDALLSPLRERMVQYRLALEIEYGDDHPFVLSLPRLYPPRGSTPDSVTVNGIWDESRQKAVLTWEASAYPAVTHYRIEYCPRAKWDSGDAETIGRAEHPLATFATNHGLSKHGGMALFRVYVVTQTGNERASNVVKVMRP